MSIDALMNAAECQEILREVGLSKELTAHFIQSLLNAERTGQPVDEGWVRSVSWKLQGLPVGIGHLLRWHGIDPEATLSLTDEQLLLVPGLGPKSLRTLRIVFPRSDN